MNIDNSTDNIYTLHAPETPLPLILDSPHSGTHLPPDFKPDCDMDTLSKADEKFLDDIFGNAPDYGACLLAALFPRTYIDVNRAIDDIAPDLFHGDWMHHDTLPLNPTKRSEAGIGLIRHRLTSDSLMYHDKLSQKDIMSRIETYYKPYHAMLHRLIDSAHAKYGQVWHINCHSMPTKQSYHSYKKSGHVAFNPFKQPDFVLGDRDGTSCDIDFRHMVRDFLELKGYNVAINDPYKGVELIERYSAPSMGRHALQIEVSKALYIHEDTQEKNKNYENLKTDMSALIAHCADYVQANLLPLAAD